MANNLTFSAEHFPSIPRSEIINKSSKHFSLKELDSLGGAFSLAASALSNVSIEGGTTKGLFKCVFPEGVVGSLSKFKDGSGFTGAIMNNGKIAAQARWIPADNASVLLSFNPAMLAMGVAMMNINRKLDVLQKTVGEILDFLKVEKESNLEGSINSMADILEQYHFNSDNDIWKSGKLSTVATVKKEAESDIIFYRKKITKNLDESASFIYGYAASKDLKKELDRNFKNYRLCTYLYAQASFLEVLLTGNYNEGFLTYVSDQLKKYRSKYWDDYFKAFDELEKHFGGNAERAIASGVGKVSRFFGEVIGKIPLISDGDVDEGLISASDSIEDFATCYSKKALKDFSNNSDSGISLFLDNIEEINSVCNRPLEIYFDNEEVFFVEDKID